MNLSFSDYGGILFPAYVLLLRIPLQCIGLIHTFIFCQIKALHLYDCLRANKSTSAWGVEARVPFLDKNFVNIAMDIDPDWKMVCAGFPDFSPTFLFFFSE